ncbi:MAG: DUF1080 domain-containing protein [Terriglobia bacterium]|jgi:hypothetical protein
MQKHLISLASLIVTAVVVVVIISFGPNRSVIAQSDQSPAHWKIHDRNRPQPPVITSGECSTQEHAGAPPSDAIVLFNGKDLDNWESINGGPAKWKVGDGYFEVVPQTGNIRTKASYGDCQLHVEYMPPYPPRGEDQDRGNSGVFLHSLYEIQVLDSYQSKTYPDGQTAAVYGQYPPIVNACRPPGQWTTYDIVFHGPRFDQEGQLTRPATVTVLHNGVLVEDHVVLTGPTEHMQRPPYKPTPEKLPLMLQDHNHSVRFRNLWIREIPEPIQ